MVNPIVAIREELVFDRRRFALALGVSYATLQAHENGLVRVVQPSIKRGLEALGESEDREKARKIFAEIVEELG